MVKNLKDQMKETMKDEMHSVEDRFAKAANIFGEKHEREDRQIIPKEEKHIVKKRRFITKSSTFTEDDIAYVEDVMIKFAQQGKRITYSEVLRMSLLLLRQNNIRELLNLYSQL